MTPSHSLRVKDSKGLQVPCSKRHCSILTESVFFPDFFLVLRYVILVVCFFIWFTECWCGCVVQLELHSACETRWAREPKGKTAHSTLSFFENLCFIETPCALMASRATIHHSMLAAVYIVLIAISADCNVTLFHPSNRRTKRGWTEHGATWKLNDGVARKKSRRELTKRALTLRYADDRSWMVMRYEKW